MKSDEGKIIEEGIEAFKEMSTIKGREEVKNIVLDQLSKDGKIEFLKQCYKFIEEKGERSKLRLKLMLK
jgi:hypothetical protein